MSNDWSIRDLAEELVSPEWVRSFDPRNPPTLHAEADTSQLNAALQEKIAESVEEEYTQEAFAASRLVGRSLSQSLAPDTAENTKRGFIVPVTKEAIFFDRTDLVRRRAAEVGEVLGLNKEKRLLDCVIQNAGQANRLTGYPLVADKGIEKAQGCVGEGKHSAIVCPASSHIAFRVFDDASWCESRLFYRRLVASGISAGDARTHWVYGDFNAAFTYEVDWPLTVFDAPISGDSDFGTDIVLRFKVSERGRALPLDASKVVYCKD